MKSIRPYITVFFAWIFILVMYYLSELLLRETGGSNTFRLISKLIVLGASIGLLFIFVKNPKKLLHQKTSLRLKHIVLIVILAGAFTAANFWEAAHDIFDFKDYESRPVISLLAITIPSIHEEIFYRGAVQTHINDKKGKGNYFISTGNIVATVLMTIAHLGFFSVMPFEFALAAFLKVILFSLIAGYFRDSLNHIGYPIVLHVTMNWIHFSIQYYS